MLLEKEGAKQRFCGNSHRRATKVTSYDLYRPAHGLRQLVMLGARHAGATGARRHGGGGGFVLSTPITECRFPSRGRLEEENGDNDPEEEEEVVVWKAGLEGGTGRGDQDREQQRQRRRGPLTTWHIDTKELEDKLTRLRMKRQIRKQKERTPPVSPTHPSMTSPAQPITYPSMSDRSSPCSPITPATVAAPRATARPRAASTVERFARGCKDPAIRMKCRVVAALEPFCSANTIFTEEGERQYKELKERVMSVVNADNDKPTFTPAGGNERVDNILGIKQGRHLNKSSKTNLRKIISPGSPKRTKESEDSSRDSPTGESGQGESSEEELLTEDEDLQLLGKRGDALRKELRTNTYLRGIREARKRAQAAKGDLAMATVPDQSTAKGPALGPSKGLARRHEAARAAQSDRSAFARFARALATEDLHLPDLHKRPLARFELSK